MQRHNRPDPDLEKNFKELQQLNFKMQVGPRSREGLTLRLTFKEKI